MVYTTPSVSVRTALTAQDGTPKAQLRGWAERSGRMADHVQLTPSVQERRAVNCGTILKSLLSQRPEMSLFGAVGQT